MAALDLKTEQLKPNTAKVTWVDVTRIVDNNWLMGGICLIAVIIFGFGLVATLAHGNIGTSMLCLLMTLLMVIYGQFGTLTKTNSVFIDASSLSHDGQVFALADISRIEYAPRTKWVGGQPQNGQPDPMQIRLWLNDNHNYVLSENNWQPQINHRIRNEIDAAITAMRKPKARQHTTQKRTAPRPKASEFGMPDY